MTQEKRAQIIEAMNAYMNEHSMSQNDIAKRTGVNAAYIVAMRKGETTVQAGNGKTVDIADKHYYKIAELIGYRTSSSYWETRPTPQLAESLEAMTDAKENGELRVLIGDTGCGKTYAVELFKRKYPSDVYVVKVSQLDNIGDILNKIVALLQPGKEIRMTNSRKLQYLIGKLREMKMAGRQILLVFDECEYMKQASLCAVKELFDNLVEPHYCGLVLAGHHQLMTNIERLRKRSKDGIPQLYRRIKFGCRYLPTIDRTFRLFTEAYPKELRSFLQENCDNYGELHDVLVPAMREAERTGEAISESFIRKVLNFN